MNANNHKPQAVHSENFMTCLKDGQEVQRRYRVEIQNGKQALVPQLYEGEQVIFALGSDVPEIIQVQTGYANGIPSLQHDDERRNPGMYGGW